ncbi:MAG: SO_0444 family Cu/Zn efflux transporter [Bacteroidaceae bacterium]|nr:SO_0444 family Cu/Zn efflux transporter [Bacteroidaceae bacterium]
METFLTFLTSLWAIILDMSPYLLLGFFIAGLLYAFVPQTLIAKHMARPGFRSVLNATLLGIPLPLCSCGVIPTTVGLRRAGVSRGACTSFLISTPQTGVDSILATYSVLGLPFAIVRPIAALVTGIFGGIATDRLMDLPSNDPSLPPHRGGDNHADGCVDESKEGVVECGCGCHSHEEASHNHAHNHSHSADESSPCGGVRGGLRGLKKALGYAFGELLEDVGKWLAVGLLIAAVITVAVPDNFFDALKDYPFVNMLIVLAIAIPMYVCATGSIPIALSLMMKGLTPGAALVLLMAGPAINSASMLVINKAFGRKQMIIYISSIVAGAILFGLGIDYLLPSEWFAVTGTHTMDACCHAEEETSWFATGCSVLFLLLLARALWHTLGGGHHHTTPSNSPTRGGHNHPDGVNPPPVGEQEGVGRVLINIEGMNCSHCAKNAQNAIEAVPGVKSAAVDHIAKTAVITADDGCSLDLAAIKKAVEDAGYEVVTK